MSLSYKFRQLAPVIEAALLQARLEGCDNWVADYRLAARIRERFGVVSKEDDVRRTASDLAKMGRIRKLAHKSMYKHGAEIDAYNLMSYKKELMWNDEHG